MNDTNLEWIKVADAADLPEGRVKTVTPRNVSICLSHFNGQWAAMDNRWILRRVASFGQPADHPVVPSIPETQYLKGFCYQRLEDGFIADPEVPSARA